MVDSGQYAFRQIHANVRPIKPQDAIIAFLAGLCGELYLPITGLGVLAMIDIAAYVLAVPLLFQWWPRLGRHSRRTVIWGLVWTMAAIISNMLNFHNTWYFFACIAVVASSWALTLLLWVLFRKDARLFLYFLIGFGIGSTVGMFYFQNGAFLWVMQKSGALGLGALVEKQIYPNYAKTIVLGVGLFVCMNTGKFSTFLSSVITIGAAVFMLVNGGARSVFGIFLVSGLSGLFVLLFPNLAKGLLKHSVFLIIICFVAAISIYGVYSHLAEAGKLGEGERLKFEKEEDINEEYDENRISARGGFKETWHVVKEKPWGEGGKLIRHSIISDSWNCNGYIGLFYWLYFYWLVFWFIKSRIVYSGKFVPFLMLVIVYACWSVLGSPFGGRHKYFALMAFISLCMDNPQYGVPDVFDDLKQRR